MSLKIPGLDTDKGMLHFGDEEVYLKVLESFIKHTPNNLEKIRDYENIDNYRIAVHTIKGSSKSICAALLGEIAEKLEKAAREGDLAYIKANTGILLDEAEKIIETISDFLTNSLFPQGEDLKPEKDFPDSDIISAIKAAADNYDMDVLLKKIAELDKYRYKSHLHLVKWLLEQAEKSEFDVIQKKLQEILA